jgi:tetratricopeptide (TPR) repeat protein
MNRHAALHSTTILAFVSLTVLPVRTSFAQANLRTIKIRVAADADIRSSVGWENRLREAIENTSRIYERFFQIKLGITEIINWNLADKSGDPDALLKVLRKDVPRGDSDLVIGFSAQKCSGRLHGMAGAFRSEALVMTNCGTPVTSEQVLVHEIGHLFGAFHVTDKKSIMASSASAPADAIDGQTKAVIMLMRNFDFQKGLPGIGQGVKKEFNSIYEQGHTADAINPLAIAARNFGLNLVEEGKTSEAIQYFQESIQIAPTFALPYVDLGIIYQGQGKLPDAMKQFGRAIELDPQLGAPYSGIGSILVAQGRLKEGVAWLTKAVTIEPKRKVSLYNLGNAYLKIGNFAEADKQFRSAIELDSSFAPPHVGRGIVLGMQGKSGEAEDELRTGVRLDPTNAAAHANLGYTLALEGKLPEAVRVYRESLRLDSTAMRTHYNLAEALCKLGMKQEAVAEIQEMRRINPTYNLPAACSALK